MEMEAWVPSIWPDEMANVLMILESSKRIATGNVPGWIHTFTILPVRIQPVSLRESLNEVRPLAQAHQLPVYDARYLHLAAKLDVPLATCDRRLLAAAPKIGVELVN
jgi:predicted nucleic acid-binding protein